MQDESFEDLGLFAVRRIYFGEEGVGLDLLEDLVRLAGPEVFIGEVEGVPVTDLHLIHQELTSYRVHLQLKRFFRRFLPMTLR